MIWGRRRRRIITSAWERAVSHERPFLSAPPQSWYLKFQPALTTQGHKREQSVLHAQPLHPLRSPPPTGERSSPSCICVCVCVCAWLMRRCAPHSPTIKRTASDAPRKACATCISCTTLSSPATTTRRNSTARSREWCRCDARPPPPLSVRVRSDRPGLEVGLGLGWGGVRVRVRARVRVRVRVRVRGVAKSQPRWALISALRNMGCKGGVHNAKTHSRGVDHDDAGVCVSVVLINISSLNKGWG